MRDIIIIKIGGKILEQKTKLKPLFKEIVLLKRFYFIVVHGGGERISSLMDALKVPVRFVHGQRYTDQQTLNIVQQVLLGEVNPFLVDLFNSIRKKAIGVSGKDAGFVEVKKLKPDLGYVGAIKSINKVFLFGLLREGYVPIIAPIGNNLKGITYNINADLFASAIASLLKAEKLFLFTDVGGVKKDKKVIAQLNRKDAYSLMNKHVISSGMIPKVRASLKALDNGVKDVYILKPSKGVLKKILVNKEVYGTRVLNS